MGALLGSGSNSSSGNASQVSKGFSQGTTAGQSSAQGSSAQVGGGTQTGQTTTSGTFGQTGQQATQGVSSTTSSSTTNVSSQYGQILAQLAQEGLGEIDPITSGFITQLQSILSGNEYTGSTIPEIKAGVDQAQQAGAQGLLETQNYLGKTGTGNSSFGADVLSQASMSAQEATGGVATEVADTFLSGLPSFIQGMTGLGYQGLAEAAATNYTSATTGKSTTTTAEDTSTANQGQFNQTQNSLSNYLQYLNNQFNTATASNSANQNFTSGVNIGNQSGQSSSDVGLGSLLLGWLLGGAPGLGGGNSIGALFQ